MIPWASTTLIIAGPTGRRLILLTRIVKAEVSMEEGFKTIGVAVGDG